MSSAIPPQMQTTASQEIQPPEADAPQRSYGELIAALAPEDARIRLRQQHGAKVFARLFGGEQLHSELQTLVQALEGEFVASVAAQDDFYSQPEHPIRQFFECLLADASHWCPRDFKLNQNYVTKLDALISSVGTSWRSNQLQAFAAAFAEFRGWIESENKRAQMLEERLCSSELAELSLLSTQCRVIEALNDSLAERPLPVELHNSFQQLLKSELQHCIVTANADEWQSAPFWKSWQRLLPALGNIFSTATIVVEDQLLYSSIPSIISELERSTELPTSNPTAYTQWIAQLNQCLMLAIQKQPLECALFEALPYPEGYSHNNTRITPALLRQSDAIKQGDWLIFSGEGADKIRCKLALKNAAADQLLFVDRTGRKVMVKSIKDFALCLSSGIAQPLAPMQLDKLIAQLMNQLNKEAQQADAQRLAHTMEKAARAVKALEAKQKAEAQAAEAARLAEQEQMEQQLEARRNAARKAMAEARALAEIKERKEREQQVEEAKRQRLREQQSAAAASAQRSEAEEAIHNLHVGAWLELQLEGSDWVRTKLSVIISSSGKYIFVDQVGRKLAEFQRDQLIQMLAEERARIIHKGDNFEDQLAKVIRGLRKDIS